MRYWLAHAQESELKTARGIHLFVRPKPCGEEGFISICVLDFFFLYPDRTTRARAFPVLLAWSAALSLIVHERVGHGLDGTTKEQPSILLFLQRFTPKTQPHRHRRFWHDLRMDPSGLAFEGTIDVPAATTVVELKRLLRARHNIALDIGVQVFELLTLDELNGLNEETVRILLEQPSTDGGFYWGAFDDQWFVY